ncbi:unnamed protein product [Dicrocoelium dendriticum]|nr:unnamed protein product [Dicrocoelium dendriticum]
MEKQRRNEAENALGKALYELKHLRKLVDDQKLLEKEDLTHAIEKLKAENAEREKLLTNLEKYAENLEKNQRFESIRSTRAQKEMKEACQRLVDRIQELEQTVQEKQKIIELGNIYSKRTVKHLQPNQPVESTECLLVDGEHGKGKLRERIKEFDQRRQDLEKRRKKIRRERMLQSRLSRSPELIEFDAGLEEHETDEKQLTSNCSTASYSTQRSNANRIGISRKQRSTTNDNQVLLPKIQTTEALHKQDSDRKRGKSPGESKQVRFNPTLEQPIRTENLSDEDKAIFQKLKDEERYARLRAEAEIMQADDDNRAQAGELDSVSESTSNNSGGAVQRNVIERFVKPSSVKLDPVSKGDSPNHFCQGTSSPIINDTIVQDGFQPHSTAKLEDMCGDEGIAQGFLEPIQQRTVLHTVHAMEANTPTSSIPPVANSPRNPRTTSEQSTFASFELPTAPERVTQLCRPFGDQEIDDFMSEETGGSSTSNSDTIESRFDDDYLWHDTPTAHAMVPLDGAVDQHARMFRGPNGLLVNAASDVDGLDIEYITEL